MKIDSKQQLLEASIELFAEKGFDNVTIRQIAESANVNSAMITYHFNNKEGLYIAVFEYIAFYLNEMINQKIDKHQEAIKLILNHGETADKHQLFSSILTQISDQLMVLMTNKENKHIVSLILAVQNRPSKAFDTLYQRYFSLLLNHFLDLVTLLIEKPVSLPQQKLLIISFLTQHTVWKMMGNTVTRFFGETENPISEYQYQVQQIAIRQFLTEIKQ
ncbi:CerR family C-terminal domain-containing protein [Vibrio sp. SS-MA-C1-2]|uniref:CerR family C-terminal domain-containing protein n=1 Tax=Vibrio sp. SS-MA-C1-2 TaxID=2908646 RepID=UPI001F256C32|nr:CerR family C-terminal domain-containing protein [Vibrio sp. SS-MA-C1-2]UJF17115.1 CerR family C-terminal domain-containing protein [Vibrio sp. SS-MA-C1-2]